MPSLGTVPARVHTGAPNPSVLRLCVCNIIRPSSTLERPLDRRRLAVAGYIVYPFALYTGLHAVLVCQLWRLHSESATKEGSVCNQQTTLDCAPIGSFVTSRRCTAPQITMQEMMRMRMPNCKPLWLFRCSNSSSNSKKLISKDSLRWRRRRLQRVEWCPRMLLPFLQYLQA
jgi:hypothetical protein